MIPLYFLMGALAVVITVLLFGFVGCDVVFGLDPVPPPNTTPPPPDDYPAVVQATPDLVAYWRLGEPPPPATTILPASMPIPPGAEKSAKDAFGGFDGYYFKLNPVTTPDYARKSPPTTGTVTLGVTPGLLEANNQENDPCPYLDGGFVQVPWDAHLNPQAFSLEAWVSPDPALDPQFYYCLAESTGPAGLSPRKTGWGLYLGPDPGNPGHLVWQVWMVFNNTFNQVAVGKYDFLKDAGNQVISQLRLTYLVLTFDGVHNVQLWLYFPDIDMDLDALETPYLNITMPNFTFLPNDVSPNGQGDFVIGAGSNLFPVLGVPPQRLYPFKGRIQEVALYKSDLSAPNNAGVQTTLRQHEMAGGNL
jgi:hypothetical protein